MSRATVGLEVGSSAVRLATVNRSRSGPVLEHIGEAALAAGAVIDGELQDRDALRFAVRQAVKSGKPGGKGVRLGKR